MRSLNERILAVLRARRDEYVRMVEALVAEGQGPRAEAFGPAEAGQMIDGLLSLLAEALEGEGSEVRSFYLQTLIPSIVAQGSGLAEIMAGSVRHSMLLVCDAVRHVRDADREAATQWFAKFFGDYLADIAGVVARSTSA